MSDAAAYPCPVCGYLVFDEPPGSYAICPICFWEDDAIQLGFPLMGGGANSISDSTSRSSSSCAMARVSISSQITSDGQQILTDVTHIGDPSTRLMTCTCVGTRK